MQYLSQVLINRFLMEPDFDSQVSNAFCILKSKERSASDQIMFDILQQFSNWLNV